MSQLQHKTLAGDSPQGKPRVYFACHPEDHRGYFEQITGEILRISNCAVFYYEPGEVALDEDYYMNLSQMQLFVMPVTTRLLYTPSRAMDVEFAYAVEHHIPVLPLMQEQGLEDSYQKKFGNLQFLDPQDADPTAIPYGEKLKKYLKSVLVGDELAQQIRAAFDAWIFLSYRKKDRKYAQELMRLIHSDPRCQDIAIWYDEFLNPGEDFNESIRAALEKSDLFVLAVTPNLLEQGNYVMREEYPEAKRAGKPILPAQMVQTDRNALKRDYDGLPELLEPGTGGAVSEAVRNALGSVAVRQNGEDPRHDYFIGLAYLSGLFVEKDHDCAVKRITQAAEADLTEAMEQLVTIYTTREATESNCRMAIPWQKKVVEKARLRWEETGGEADAERYIDCLRRLRGILKRIGGDRSSKGDRSGAKEWYRQAVAVMERIAEIGTLQDLRSLCTDYREIANLEHADGNLTAAREWYHKELETAHRIAESGTPEDLRYLTIGYMDLADAEKEGGNLFAAMPKYHQAMLIEERIAESGIPRALPGQSLSYARLGDGAKELGDLATARKWYGKALEIDERIAQSGVRDDLKNLSVSYERLGQLATREKDLPAVRKWYRKSLEIKKQVAALTNNPMDHEELADAFSRMGILDEDMSLLEESLSIRCMLAREYPRTPRYQQNVEIAEKHIRKQLGLIKYLWFRLFYRKRDKHE